MFPIPLRRGLRRPYLLLWILLALVGALVSPGAPLDAQAAPTARRASAARVPVRIRAALVMPDLAVRALPQVGLRLVHTTTGEVTTLTTDLDGVASTARPAGAYRLETVDSVTVGNAVYRWSVPVQVAPGLGTVELTAKNAVVTAAPTTPAVAQQAAAARPTRRRVSEEAGIFDQVKSGVFTIYGQKGKGSGFLVDTVRGLGVVLTNAHVVDGTDEARVVVAPETKLRARILKIDKQRDVAVLAIHLGRCGACAVLPLADTTGGTIAEQGERVLAIGSPLNQTGILTIGIVSKVEPRAIISDVNINHGNSGGPLLNLDGRVIAINTFGDFTNQGGPGVSGSILITQAHAALEEARTVLAAGQLAASDSLLPLAPSIPFPIEGLKAAAERDKYDLRAYNLDAGPFILSVMTPPVMAWRQAQAAKALTARRKQREAKGNVTENERIDAIQGWVSWDEYVGERRSAVVVQVTPKVGQTTGSMFANVLGALAAGYAGTYYEPHRTLEFKGDFRSMRFFRDTTEIIPVELWRIPAVLNVQDYYTKGLDVANQGIYVFRPEDFAPYTDGTPPRFRVEIVNTSKRTQPVRLDLPEKTPRSVWADFAPYRVAAEARAP